MTTASRPTRAKTAFWFATSLGIVLVACGSLTGSPHDPPDTSFGGDSGTVQAGTTHGGGSTTSSGGTSGGITLVMTTAGTASGSTPLPPGTAGEGGQPDYPAVVRLCIDAEDIPEHWGQGGEGGGETVERGCVVGAVGDFNFMGCLYDLLSPAAFNVDPFVGGHSGCCYTAKLIACE
jgi:hypothetical protein